MGTTEERLRRLTPAEIEKRDRDCERLAQRLYDAHNTFRFIEQGDCVVRPRWFALHDDLKASYRFAARAILSGQIG